MSGHVVLTSNDERVPDYGLPAARAVAQLRVPPHSVEAESSVLGGLMLDPQAFDRVGDLLQDGDFYRYEHRLVYAAISALVLANRPADCITVYETLQRQGKQDEVGGMAYLNALAQYVPSAGNIRRYAEIVRERALLRNLIAAADQTCTMAFNTNGESVSAVIDKAEQLVRAVAEQRGGGANEGWQWANAGVVELLDTVQHYADSDDTDYTPTGLAFIDGPLDGGLRGGEFYVIGARPRIGKSVLLKDIQAGTVAMTGRVAATFNLEMPNRQHWRRAMAQAARIRLQHLRRPKQMTDEDWRALTRGVEKMRDMPWASCELPGLNILQVRSKARALARQAQKQGLRLGCIGVDYLQLMSGTNSRAKRHEQLEEASRGLKNLAKELDVPVIACAQVSRSVEKEYDSMPRLSDLKDCGAIEQDADAVLFIDRPFENDKRLVETDANFRYYGRMGWAKIRDGEGGERAAWFDGAHMAFTDWPDSDAQGNTLLVPKAPQRGRGTGL